MRISDWSSDVCSSDLYQKALGLELARCALDLARDLVADRFHGLDRAAAVAGRTRLAQDVPERFAGALARHLDQAERRERMDLRAGVIGCQRTFQRTQHLGTMILGFHVDEIENDAAAEVAQSQLARNRLRGFEIRSEEHTSELQSLMRISYA